MVFTLRRLSRSPLRVGGLLLTGALVIGLVPGPPAGARAAADPSTAAASVPVTTLLGAADPGLPGPYDVVTSDYEVAPSEPGPGATSLTVAGHVVEPTPGAATGPRPLVMIMAGQDGAPGFGSEGYPSHLGFDYLQRVLASQGYATVSVDVRDADGNGSYGAHAGVRAAIIEAQLGHWVDLAAEHQVDLDQVVLVGHGEGAEGANQAALQIPLSAAYRVAGQVLIAPWGLGRTGLQSAAYVPTVTMLPSCDGIAGYLEGQQRVDAGRDLDAEDTSFKSSVLVMGANHNFFNTEWTPGTASGNPYYVRDDAVYRSPKSDQPDPTREKCHFDQGTRIDAEQQQSVATAYVAGAVALFTGDDSYLPLFDGSAVTVGSIGAADVRSHALGGGRSLRRPGLEATPGPTTGGAVTSLCDGFVATYRQPSTGCGRDFTYPGTGIDYVLPHWRMNLGYDGDEPVRPFFEMSWSEAGATGGLRFQEPLDLSADRLELRTILDPTTGPVDLQVRLGDSTGATVSLTPTNTTDDGDTLAPPPIDRNGTKMWAQALLVDAPAATGQGVDLSDVVSVDLVGVSGPGHLWVADLAAAPDALVPVPDVRLPRLSLGPDLKVDEGDGPADGTAELTFEIAGELTRPASVTASVHTSEVSRAQVVVDLEPGQTSGVIPVPFPANVLDDRYLPLIYVDVFATRNIAVDADNQARLRVRDDDPTPRVQVRPVQRRVVEGEPIVLQATLTSPSSDRYGVLVEVVRGPGTNLRGNDVSPTWLAAHADVAEPRRSLFRLGASTKRSIGPGARTATIRVPTSSDRRREGAESLTVRVTVGLTAGPFIYGGRVLTRTVKVVDPRRATG